MTAHAHAHSPVPDRPVPDRPVPDRPVPDRPYLVLRPAPSTEPPFDDELPTRHLRLVGALAEPLPFDDPLSFGGPGPRLLEEPLDFFDRQPTSRHALPEPREWLRHLLRVVLECLEGWRPAVQLRQFAVPEVVTVVAARRKQVGRPGAAPRVCSLRVTEPVNGVVESCAVVHRGGRPQAVAIRLEGLDGRWQCVALDVIDRPLTV